MLQMPATSGRRRSGPFLLPARLVLLGSGVLALGLAAFNLFHEFHAGQVDGVYTIIAAVVAAIWLVGGLWVGRVRRTGALLIALATFGVAYSFLSLHLIAGTSVTEIQSTSGTGWAVVAAAAAVLATASFLIALGLVIVSLVRRRPTAVAATAQAARRGA